MRNSLSLASCCVVLVALLAPWSARASGCFYLDFDDDNDPWTLRTSLPSTITQATLKIVLEVPSTPPLGSGFRFQITEGCCNDLFNNGHYGVKVDATSVRFDPAFVADFLTELPICTECCPWEIDGDFTPHAPMVPGQRYFIGEAQAQVYCVSMPPYCNPPNDFNFEFATASGCSPDTVWASFSCPAVAVPVGPLQTRRLDWGRVKNVYR